jgi:hypothetical protein
MHFDTRNSLVTACQQQHLLLVVVTNGTCLPPLCQQAVSGGEQCQLGQLQWTDLHKPPVGRDPDQHRTQISTGGLTDSTGVGYLRAATNVSGANGLSLAGACNSKTCTQHATHPAQAPRRACSSAHSPQRRGPPCRSLQQLILWVDVLLQEHSVRTVHILLNPTVIGNHCYQLALRTRARAEAALRDTLRPASVLG